MKPRTIAIGDIHIVSGELPIGPGRMADEKHELGRRPSVFALMFNRSHA